MSSVLLVTSHAHDDLFVDGEPGHQALDQALSARGIESRWVLWDDPEVDWAAADLVVVRATWDYTDRAAEFLTWTRRLAASRLLNGADIFTWNHDKAYLSELSGLPVVPTERVGCAAEVPDAVARTLAAWPGSVVVKPAVGAGGFGLVVVDSAQDPQLGDLPDGAWAVQPLVEAIRTEGETSVFLVDGAPVCQVDKLPGAGEVRVHEHFGGESNSVEITDEARAVSVAAYDWLVTRFGRPIDYGRVDLIRWNGALAISELELIEPGLYLDVVPSNAEPFADLVASRLPG